MLGIIVLLLLVCGAVALTIHCFKTKRTRTDHANRAQIQRIRRAMTDTRLSVGCEAYTFEQLAWWCQRHGIVRRTDGKDYFEMIPKDQEKATHKIAETEKGNAMRNIAKDCPPIVCLCGSTEFMDAYRAVDWQLTLLDHIVLSPGICKHEKNSNIARITVEIGQQLDKLQYQKIILSDWVLVLNIGGYIGPSTRDQIKYAVGAGTPVVYLVDAVDTKFMPEKKNRQGWAALTTLAEAVAEKMKNSVHR